MRTHQQLLRLRAPDVDTGDGGGGGGGANNGAPPAPTRPDGLPDEYWDAEKGVRFDAILPRLKEYDDLRSSIATKPEDFDWTLPANLDPDNPDVVYEVDKNDPFLGEVTKLALEHKAPKGLMNALAGAFARREIAQFKEAQKLLTEETKKLGEKAQERIAGAQKFVADIVGAEKAERFRQSWVTAEQVEIIEAIAAKLRGPNPTNSGDPPNSDPKQLPTDERERARVWFGNSKTN